MKSLLALADEECRVLWDNLCLGMYVHYCYLQITRRCSSID